MICRPLIKLPFYCEKKNLWTELTSADKSYHDIFILVVDTHVRAPSCPSMAFLSGFGTFSAARQDKADQAGSCLCFQSLFRWGLDWDPTADHPCGCLDATLIPGISMKLPGGSSTGRGLACGASSFIWCVTLQRQKQQMEVMTHNLHSILNIKCLM